MNTYNILDFGAVADDVSNNAGVIQQAIDEAAKAGGCFIFACHEKNVTISGEGVIYGQGDKVFVDDNADNGAHECPLQVAAFRPRTTFLEDVENLTVRDGATIEDIHIHHVTGSVLKYADGLEIWGKVHFEEPYSVDKNGLYELENCTKEEIVLKEI